MIRRAAAAFVIAAWCLLPAAAHAQGESPVLISDRDALQLATKDGAVSTSVTFINTLPTPAQVDFALVAPTAGCALLPTSRSVSLPAHQQTEIPLKFSGCDASKPLVIAAVSSGTTYLLNAKAEATTPPQWAELAAGFLAAAGFAAVTMMLVWWYWHPEHGAKEPWRPLDSLAPTWSFGESWATNITAALAAFMALFTTDLFKTALGKGAEALGASLLFSAVCAALLVALAPVVLQTLRLLGTGSVTVIGVLVAAGFTLTAALGEIIAIGVSLGRASSPLPALGLVVLGVVVALLFVAYAATNTLQTLNAGTAPKTTAGGARRGRRRRSTHRVGGTSFALSFMGSDIRTDGVADDINQTETSRADVRVISQVLLSPEENPQRRSAIL